LTKSAFSENLVLFPEWELVPVPSEKLVPVPSEKLVPVPSEKLVLGCVIPGETASKLIAKTPIVI
jgi:hypothetical protein